MVNAHDQHSEDIEWLQSKVADLEDRSQRNNLKNRGTPESVSLLQLPHYLRDLFKAVIPQLSSEDLTIDRIHRIPKPSFLPQEIPRDVLMLIYYHQVKECILTAFLKKTVSLSKLSLYRFFWIFLLTPSKPTET